MPLAVSEAQGIRQVLFFSSFSDPLKALESCVSAEAPSGEVVLSRDARC